jgi:chemosensory pili system protein ChpA (sensor histidine kinase/response regulator)
VNIVNAPVLIVEDDFSTRVGYVQLLTRAGFDVVSAANGQEACDLIEKGLRPSVLVLDLDLPRVSGQQLLSYIHDDRTLREVPVVVVTGHSETDVHVSADVVLFKPLCERELTTTVRQLHEGSQSKQYAP